MPAATVTHDAGTTPVIAGAAQRTMLLLQNNSARDMRYRLFGPVSMSEPTQKGLLLRAGGGSLILTGPAAQRAVYAIHGAGSGITDTLDYEADYIPA